MFIIRIYFQYHTIENFNGIKQKFVSEKISGKQFIDKISHLLYFLYL